MRGKVETFLYNALNFHGETIDDRTTGEIHLKRKIYGTNQSLKRVAWQAKPTGEIKLGRRDTMFQKSHT